MPHHFMSDQKGFSVTNSRKKYEFISKIIYKAQFSMPLPFSRKGYLQSHSIDLSATELSLVT